MSSVTTPPKLVTELEPFIGIWLNTGVLFDDAGREIGRMRAIDSYEWLDGGFFILHHVEGKLGNDAISVLEIIGVQHQDNRIVARFFDNRGMTGEQTQVLNGRTFTVDGPQQRFRGEFDEEFHALEGLWEMSEDGKTWRPWMKITLEKQGPAASRAPGKTATPSTRETRH